MTVHIKTVVPIAVLFFSVVSAPLYAHAEEAVITPGGIVAATNAARAQHGQTPLSTDATLTQIAQKRAADMFTHQYFSHTSPQGIDAESMAHAMQYEYFLIAENIAFGNLSDSESVVGDWLNSPAHRANILNDALTRIGVAAQQGEFDGAPAWIVVQVFARPRSLCTAPDHARLSMLEDRKKFAESIRSFLHLHQAPAGGDAPTRALLQGLLTQLSSAYTQFVATLNVDIQEYNRDLNAYVQCAHGA